MCRLARRRRSTSWRWGSVIGPRSPSVSSSAYPPMALSGVRSSWLMVDRNWLFAASAAARWRSASLRSRSASARARSASR